MIKYVIFSLSLITALQAQILGKQDFLFQKPISYESEQPLGNGVIDILTVDSSVWAATGFGLSKSLNSGNTWEIFTTDDYLGKGGISALDTMDKKTLWIAVAYDSSVQDEDLPVGGGLRYTNDGGQTWNYIAQPVDSADETEYSPTTTRVQNLTYDIAIMDSSIWIASFGGGLRKSDDMGQTWNVVTTDGLPFSALKYLNHRAFSTMVENGNVWIGTAQGISKSSDKGNTWRRFTHSNQLYPISGNFVVALGYQEATNAVWAATIEATDTSEVRAVSKTINGGETWEIYLKGMFAHNFAFDGEKVFVAADEGMFVSDNGGENWYQLPHPVDAATGEEILTDIYYSAGASNTNADRIYWVGSADGLASTADNGNNWRLHRSYQSTQLSSSPATYAYPSPFSPSRQGYVRFQFDIKKAGEAVVDIFDFAMDKVTTIKEFENSPQGNSMDRSVKWDGRNDDGEYVATGVYFFRVRLNGKSHWGNLVIIN